MAARSGSASDADVDADAALPPIRSSGSYKPRRARRSMYCTSLDRVMVALSVWQVCRHAWMLWAFEWHAKTRMCSRSSVGRSSR